MKREGGGQGGGIRVLIIGVQGKREEGRGC